MTPYFLRGIFSGFASTLPMTAAMELGYRYLPVEHKEPLPPRQITDRITELFNQKKNLNEKEEELLTLAAHFGYGAVMGAVYQLIRRNRKRNLLRGATFGMAVWAGSYLGLLPALDLKKSATKEAAERNALMIVAHLVWGSSLELFQPER